MNKTTVGLYEKLKVHINLNNGHYSNVFNVSAKIVYGLPVRSRVKIFIYDLNGQWLETLINTSQEAG